MRFGASMDKYEFNYLKENWSIINKEIDTFFNRKLIDFETEMHDIVEGITYKMIHDIIKKEFSETKNIIVQILEGLKEDGIYTTIFTCVDIIK